MELGNGELGVEIKVAEVEAEEESFGFGDGAALTKEPGEEFELGDVIFAVDVVVIGGVTDKVETGGAETFFVDGVVEQRIAVGDVGDADDGKMRFEASGFTEAEGEIARDNDGLFAIRKFVIEITPEIVVGGLKSCCGAHVYFPVYVGWIMIYIIAQQRARRELFGIRREFEVEADVFRGFLIEVFFDGAANVQ